MDGIMEKQIFEGLKFVEFAWLAVGPLMGSFLANYGAEVIKIESSLRPDTLRTTPPFQKNRAGINRSGWFAKYNQNRDGITLNMKHPKSRRIVEKLIQWGDVVSESFAPSVLKKWGWGYKEFAKIKPDIIMISASGQGQTGPNSQLPGYGPHLSSLSGFVHLTGWPDRSPAMVYGAYTDFVAPYFGAAALVAALDFHRRTGKGQYIDLSQYECAAQFLSPVILDYHVNKRVQERSGNRSPYAAPHGVYRCRGQDEWCTIAVFSDEEWEIFCSILSDPDWTKKPKFSSLLGRKKNEKELDCLIEEWTLNRSARNVMELMQKAGIASGVVNDNEALYLDPQLNHRRHFRKVNHPEMGIHSTETLPFQLSANPFEFQRPSPCLGQDNFSVYTDVLGLPVDEFIRLSEEGVFE